MDIKMKNKDKIEYEDYIKNIVDKFISMVNTEELYLTWCNDYQSKHQDDRITFYPARPDVLFKLSLDGEFDKQSVREKFNEKQQKALEYLKANTISFEEYKNRKNGKMGNNS
jgi:hypothetical protein